MAKGLSIIELLIGASIMSVVALGMATVFTDAFRSQSTLNKKDAARDVAREIRMILGNPTACMNTLGAKPIGGPATSALPVVDASGNSVFTTATPAIQSLMFTSSGTTGTVTLTGNTSLGPNDVGVGGISRPVEILISLMPNGSGGIASCAALSEMTDGIWRRQAPLSQDIYFGTPAVGKVGIGIYSALSKLHVQSDNADVMTVEREGAGDLNSTIQFRNGASRKLYLGMSADETFGVGPSANLSSVNTWFEINRSQGAQIRSFGSPSVLTLIRERNGVSNADIKFVNGSNRTFYVGMSGDEAFGVGPNPDLSSNDTWLYVERSRGATIRAAQPAVLTLVRENNQLNSAIRFLNADPSKGDVFVGMSPSNGFGVGPNANLNSQNWFYCVRTGCEVGGRPVATTSDERLKDEVKPVENALGRVLNLRGVSFTWNEKSQIPGEKDMGVIAQEVEKQFPEAVRKSEQSDYKVVAYTTLIAPIIEAIRELNKKTTTHETEVENLRRELNEIKLLCSKK